MHAPRLKHPQLASEVFTRCAAGHAQVLRCAPVMRNARTGRLQPFPTLFWLACPDLHRGVALLESTGVMQRILADLHADPDFRERLAADHRAYRDERFSSVAAADRAELERLGLAADVRERGIGGMRNLAAVKCLHLHLAHHLARGNAIGRWLDERDMLPECGGADDIVKPSRSLGIEGPPLDRPPRILDGDPGESG